MEVNKREAALRGRLEEGRTKAKSGETQAAVDTFKSVVEQKCLFPRPAKEAVKELKKLGVADTSAMVIPAESNTDHAFSEKIEKVMLDGLTAENDAKYAAAERFYTEAHHMDPADPAPLRYLGELYRHEIGDWDKATLVFKEILAMDADPLSRAVALHGLGKKMTIHTAASSRRDSRADGAVGAGLSHGDGIQKSSCVLEQRRRCHQGPGLYETGDSSRS